MSDIGPASWRRRPAELSRTIDAVLADARFGPLLAADKVGVWGMSAGGMTALVHAGGRWSPAAFLRHCEAHLAQDFPACAGYARLRGDASDVERLAAASGWLRQLPADPQWYSHQDPRVAAVLAVVPLAAPLDPASLVKPRVPLGIVRVGQDLWLAPAFHVNAVLRACASCELVADLPTAGHGSFLSPPPPGLQGVAAELLGDPPGFDRALVAPAYGRMVDFFRQKLLP
jgi:predicted dienelactone hydrolase